METKDKTVVHLDVDNSEYIQRPLFIIVHKSDAENIFKVFQLIVMITYL